MELMTANPGSRTMLTLMNVDTNLEEVLEPGSENATTIKIKVANISWTNVFITAASILMELLILMMIAIY